MLRIGGGHGASAPLPTLRARRNGGHVTGRAFARPVGFAHPTRYALHAVVRSLSNTAGKLSDAIEGAHRGEAVLDTTLPGKPRCTTGASPSAGYIRFRTASRQPAAVSRRRSAELCYATSYLGLAYKRVQLRSETRGEVRPTNSRTRLGLFCNAEYDRCGGTECYDDQARNTHRILRSQVKSEIIPHDLARNDNSSDEESADWIAFQSYPSTD